jgi:hypothetical protein
MFSSKRCEQNRLSHTKLVLTDNFQFREDRDRTVHDLDIFKTTLTNATDGSVEVNYILRDTAVILTAQDASNRRARQRSVVSNFLLKLSQF